MFCFQSGQPTNSKTNYSSLEYGEKDPQVPKGTHGEGIMQKKKNTLRLCSIMMGFGLETKV